MNRLKRALVGAAVGALAVLALHPGSRPFLLSAFQGWSRRPVLSTSPYLLENLESLPAPRSGVDGSLWMDAVAAEVRAPAASRLDMERALKVCDLMHKLDPENAYWTQMKATVLGKLGRASESDAAWIQASRATRWDNYRATRALLLLKELERKDGRSLAWHAAATYRFGSSDSAMEIRKFADRSILKPLDTRSGLDFRYATLENGRLMRDGAKVVSTGTLGSSMIEVAYYPADIAMEVMPKKMLLARTAFLDELKKNGLSQEAERARQAFRSNDGWTATMPKITADNKFGRLGLIALFAVALPGALFLISLLGANLWLMSELMRKPRIRALLRPSVTPVIGLIIGGAIWKVAGQALPGIAVAACIGFLAFTPPGGRRDVEPEFGTSFLVISALFAVALAVFLTLFVGGITAPGREVLASLDQAEQFHADTTIYAIPAIIVFALLVLTAPGWAYGLRVSTGTALAAAFRTVGQMLFVGCLTLAILGTPVAAILDVQAGVELRKIATNEPVYYFLL